jgi:hypothetical protein
MLLSVVVFLTEKLKAVSRNVSGVVDVECLKD